MTNELSNKELELLKQFRSALKDVWRDDFDDDYFLIRWLRARKFKLADAEKMLREYLKWRDEFKTDDILEWEPPEVVKKYYAGGYCGHDKEGCPLWVDITGLTDLRGLAKCVSMATILRYQIRNLEYGLQHHLPLRSAEEGKRITRLVNIFDMTSYGLKDLWAPGFELYGKTSEIAEKNYPDTMKKCFIINAPAIFPIAYRLIRPFIDDDTAQKIVVLGKNYRETLLKYFDPEHLPARYGGTLVDSNGDPNCSEQICYAGPVPEAHYVTADKDNFNEVVIRRRDFLELEFVVKTQNSVFKWKFKTRAHDIGFTCWCKGNTDDRLIPYKRINASSFLEEGEALCSTPGVYVVRFDNSYSQMRAKYLSYNICVIDGVSGDSLVPNDFHMANEMSEKDLGADENLVADQYIKKIGIDKDDDEDFTRL